MNGNGFPMEASDSNNNIPSVGDVFELSDHGNSTCDDENDVLDSDINDNSNDDSDDDDDNIIVSEIPNDYETNHSNDNENNFQQQQQRCGTVSSARFNILSTMVGGGCLSLPLAFQKSGNGLIGPILLLITAYITEYVFRIHVHTARIHHQLHMNNARSSSYNHVGNDSFEKIATVAFGSYAYVFCTLLVTLICFFGTVGYAVLLRDMLRPINDELFGIINSNEEGSAHVPSWKDNVSMWIVVVLVTPACTLRTLTSLQKFGALGMMSVIILGCCIFYRSGQCVIHNYEASVITSYFQLFPNNWMDVLDVIPLYISCYVCHYNILPVHNELIDPTKKRVKTWLQSTVWLSTLFYLCMGLAGSIYGKCRHNGDNSHTTSLHGNILLDFPESDPLLFIGRMCLAITITLAFPMLTIPARDILIRSIPSISEKKSYLYGILSPFRNDATATTTNTSMVADPSLTAALLEDYNDSNPSRSNSNDEAISRIFESSRLANIEEVEGQRRSIIQPENFIDETNTMCSSTTSFVTRLLTAIFMFWTATAVASCVSSIDIVWDLLGSSLSILLSYLMPCGSYLLFVRQKQKLQQQQQSQRRSRRQRASIVISILLLCFYTPLMFISTANAIRNTFFK